MMQGAASRNLMQPKSMLQMRAGLSPFMAAQLSTRNFAAAAVAQTI